MILIMGEPVSWKSLITEKLLEEFESKGIQITTFDNDDLSGEEDQHKTILSKTDLMAAARRMRKLVDDSKTLYNIVNIEAPLIRLRTVLNPAYLIFVDTLGEVAYEAADSLWVPPTDLKKQTVIRILSEDSAKLLAQDVVEKITISETI